MDEFAYFQYMNESRKADELHKLIEQIATEEDWTSKHPGAMTSSRTMHMYACINGLINRDEYFLLCRFF